MTWYFHAEDRLRGTLVSAITSTATSGIRMTFTDKITGDARTPNTNTRLFTIDKGDDASPNENYEIIYAPNGFTVNATGDITLSATGLIRGCPRNYGEWATDNPFTAVTANQKPHESGDEVGLAVSHFIPTIPAAIFAGQIPTGTNKTRVGDKTAGDQSHYWANDHTVEPRHYWDDSLKRSRISWGDDAPASGDIDGVGIPELTTAERDALTWPDNGPIIFNSTTGEHEKRQGGAWVTVDSGGSFPNGSTTVAGKFEEATVAEQGSATATGATGARLVPANANLVKTSSGAGDENKIPILDSSGKLALGFQRIEDDAYGVGWNGDTDAPSKNSVYDKIESLNVSSAVMKAGSFSVTLSAGGANAGTENVTGVGFTPSVVEIECVITASYLSHCRGVTDGSTQRALYDYDAANPSLSTTKTVYLNSNIGSSTADIDADVTPTADGFDIAWDVPSTGDTTGSATVNYIAICHP